MSKFEAKCAWGFADDVILVVDNATFDLTSEEARKLAFKLLNAANQADELERICQEHDDYMEGE